MDCEISLTSSLGLVADLIFIIATFFGGGQDASAITTTDHLAGKFEAKFYDKVLQEEIGGVKGHFGLINALAFNPDGKRLNQISNE
ncbi:hypothetical protein L1887_13657 [Cichorium endivia]|nr:hypothetical protein L1887_13657 [Cichorium endivia]